MRYARAAKGGVHTLPTMPRTVAVRAYAKINLHLRIGQRDPASGYHALETLFQTVSLYDTLRVRPAGTVRLRGRMGALPRDRTNLALRAAHTLKDHSGTSRGAELELIKRIPVAAGLGGGSTDAAAGLCALNLLWGTGLDVPALHSLARGLGADVPFLLEGGAAIATGIGDVLRAVPQPPRPWWVLLITSDQGISTAEAYGALSSRDKSPEISLDKPQFSNELEQIGLAWARGEWPAATVNSFERPIFAVRPHLRDLVETLLGLGAADAHLSGSGPSVYGLFRTRAEARTAAAALRLSGSERAHVTKTVARSPVAVP